MAKRVSIIDFKGTGVSQALSEGILACDSGHTWKTGGRGIDRRFQQLTEKLKQRMDEP